MRRTNTYDINVYIILYACNIYRIICVCQLVEPFNAAERVGHFVKYKLTLNSKYLMTSRASKHTGGVHKHTRTLMCVCS